MPSPIITIGLGDLFHLDAVNQEERSDEWLREASDRELIGAGICPSCRGSARDGAIDCKTCVAGRVVQCEECGGAIRPGSEQVLPVFVDRPNGPRVTLCQRCAEMP
jgi:hypothetical protein